MPDAVVEPIEVVAYTEPVEVVAYVEPVEIVVATNVIVNTSGIADDLGNIAATRAFTYNDVTILPIATIVGRIVRVLVILDVAFNDPSATLSVGDAGDITRLQNTLENLPGYASVYTSYPNHVYAIATDVNLYISPASSSVGSGIVMLLRD